MMRRTAQSMLLLLMVTTLATATFAQDATGGKVPPVLPPPAIAPAPPTAATSLPSLPAATLPEPPAANDTALPSMPATSTPPSQELSTMLNDLSRATYVPESAQVAKTYSFGNSSLSILFLPTQVEKMKTAIRTYENSAKAGSTTFAAPEPVIVAGPAPVIPEPANYPVFYLASIAYDSPGQWSLWVSGHKITSRRNNTDLSIVHVGPDSVTFSWSPTYLAAINQRHDKKEFAAIDPVKNRLLTSQPINLDQTNNAVTFTLKTNQSFGTGYFSLFEGFVPSPKMPPMAVANPNAPAGSAPSFTSTQPNPPLASPFGTVPAASAAASAAAIQGGAVAPGSIPPRAGMPAANANNPQTVPAAMNNPAMSNPAMSNPATRLPPNSQGAMARPVGLPAMPPAAQTKP